MTPKTIAQLRARLEDLKVLANGAQVQMGSVPPEVHEEFQKLEAELKRREAAQTK